MPVVPTSGVPAPHSAVDASAALKLLARWLQVQNEGRFDEYAALYDRDFVGVRRVGDESATLERAVWLADRKKMFERGAQVKASEVQVLQKGGLPQVLFTQRWSTSTFADEGTKVLGLRQVAGELRIVREEMLTSRVLTPDERRGACFDALEEISNATSRVRYFAAVGAGENAGDDDEPGLVEVESPAAANRQAVDGYAWELWASVVEDDWHAARVQLSTHTGDWLRVTTFCFREDGTLAEVADSHRTFYSVNGLVDDTVVIGFSREGELLARKHDAYYMQSGEPAEPNSYIRPPPMIIMHENRLPFSVVRDP